VDGSVRSTFNVSVPPVIEPVKRADWPFSFVTGPASKR